MIWRLIPGLVVLLGGLAVTIAPARAAEFAAPMAGMPDAASSTQIVPPDCAAADAELTRRLQPALLGSRDLPSGVSLGDALASLYKARALCKAGSAAQGMLVYIRLSDALALPSGQQP